MARDLFFVVLESAEHAEFKMLGHILMTAQPNRAPLLEILHVVVNARAVTSKGNGVTARPSVYLATIRPMILCTAENVVFVSWDGETLDPFLPASAVPKPGIVLALLRPQGMTGSWPPGESGSSEIAVATRSVVDISPSINQSLREFMSSPAARVEPVLPQSLKVFISHAADDRPLVEDLHRLLLRSGVDTVMASMDTDPEEVWAESTREALRNCGAAAIVLTPNSKDRPWVMAEARAMWALGIPLIPAISYVKSRKFLETIRCRPCIDVTTARGQEKCAEALVHLLNRK